MPSYLRLIFNTIEGVDFSNLKGSVHADVYFTVNVKDLPDSVAEHVKTNVRFLFANDPEIVLREEADQEDDGTEIYFEEEKERQKGVLINHYYHFHVRKNFTASMVTDLFLTPFEIIDFILLVTVKINPMKIQDVIKEEELLSFPTEFMERKRSDKKLSEIKFGINLMDHPEEVGLHERATIDYGIVRNFGNYSVADRQLSVEYSNESVSKEII